MASVQSYDDVLRVEKDGAVATVVLDRPGAMNALSKALRNALSRAFRALQADEAIRVAILTGEGRAFCAGIDLKELAGADSSADAREGEGLAPEFEGDVMEAIAAFEGPVIGAINGHAVTGGFELALACDVLVASSGARFADTHARVGILPGWGLSQKLPRLIGESRAKEMSFTGNFIDAEQALAWGLVNRVVEPDRLLPTCRALAADMVSCVPHVLRDYKKLIDDGLSLPFGEALRLEAERSVASMRAIQADDVAKRREAIVQRGRDATR